MTQIFAKCNVSFQNKLDHWGPLRVSIRACVCCALLEVLQSEQKVHNKKKRRPHCHKLTSHLFGSASRNYRENLPGGWVEFLYWEGTSVNEGRCVTGCNAAFAIRLFSTHFRYLPGVSVRRHTGKTVVSPLCMHGKHQVYTSGLVRFSLLITAPFFLSLLFYSSVEWTTQSLSFSVCLSAWSSG